MADAKETCRTIIAAALNEFIKEKDPSAATVDAASIVVQNAPNPEMGDLGAPMFAFAKALRMAPPQIAAGVVTKITDKSLGEFLAVGPYVNVKLDTFQMDKECQQAMYDIATEMGLESKALFTALYQALIAKEQGPRLGSFFRIIGKERLTQILSVY